MSAWCEALKKGVIRVGDGRGFLVAGFNEVLVITAAHCLAEMPGRSLSNMAGGAYSPVWIGPLQGGLEVKADCIFADPFADIAVLRCPDEQQFSSDADAYEHLIAGASTLTIDCTLARSSLGEIQRDGMILSIDGTWQPCKVVCSEGGPLQLEQMKAELHAEMAGSPIISMTGAVLGVLSFGGPSSLSLHAHLALDLPPKFLRWVTVPGISSRSLALVRP